MGRSGLDMIVVVDLETTCWEKRERPDHGGHRGGRLFARISGPVKSPRGRVFLSGQSIPW